jgi:hypothetical protein
MAFRTLKGFMKLQKLGGYAAFAGILLVILIGFCEFRINQFGNLSDPVKAMAAVLAVPNVFYGFNLIIILGRILDLVVRFALYERMQAGAPNLTRAMLIAASAVTIIAIANSMIAFANIRLIQQIQDVSVYRAWDMINTGLNHALDHAGAWVGLFAGCAIVRTRAFSRILGGLILLGLLLGILKYLVPQLEVVSTALGFIATIWIGIALIRQKQPQPEAA